MGGSSSRSVAIMRSLPKGDQGEVAASFPVVCFIPLNFRQSPISKRRSRASNKRLMNINRRNRNPNRFSRSVCYLMLTSGRLLILGKPVPK